MRFIRTYSQSQLLRYAGLFTWVCVGISLPFIPRLSMAAARPDVVGTVVAYLGFALAYWILTREMDGAGRRWVYLLTLVAMTLSSLAIGHLTGTGIGAILILVCASVLPWVLPLGLSRALMGRMWWWRCCSRCW